MARREIDRRVRLRKEVERSPELLRASRQLALLAITQQTRSLNPRETEELRRALTAAGTILEWSNTSASDADLLAEVSQDVASLAALGVDSLISDLAEDSKSKETETSRLGEAVAYARKLAADPKTTYPVDITYSYTARDPFGGLVTKHATNTVTNGDEALGAADSLERSIESRSKLTDLIVVDIAERRDRLQEILRNLPDFAKSSRWLLEEVIASLH